MRSAGGLAMSMPIMSRARTVPVGGMLYERLPAGPSGRREFVRTLAGGAAFFAVGTPTRADARFLNPSTIKGMKAIATWFAGQILAPTVVKVVTARIETALAAPSPAPRTFHERHGSDSVLDVDIPSTPTRFRYWFGVDAFVKTDAQSRIASARDLNYEEMRELAAPWVVGQVGVVPFPVSRPLRAEERGPRPRGSDPPVVRRQPSRGGPRVRSVLQYGPAAPGGIRSALDSGPEPEAPIPLVRLSTLGG
jgi:hypothetical protein